MKRSVPCLLLAFISLFVSSCESSGILDGVNVLLSDPEQAKVHAIDQALRLECVECLNPIDIQIVKDSILVLQDLNDKEGAYQFKAYSANSLKYLGGFGIHGRGPGELVSPHIEKCISEDPFLHVIDNGTGLRYEIDVLGAIQDGGRVMSDAKVVPRGAISCHAIDNTSDMALIIEGTELVYEVMDKGETRRMFSPYKHIDCERSITQLSSTLVGNSSGMISEIMMFLPQINFINVDEGTIRTTAVDRRYRNWKQIMSCMISPDAVQYYSAGTSSKEHVLALYDCSPLSDIMQGLPSRSRIHVFDWSGHLKSILDFDDAIQDMTYDERNQALYCIEKNQGKILRYSLKKLSGQD